MQARGRRSSPGSSGQALFRCICSSVEVSLIFVTLHMVATRDKSLECPPWYAARDVAWNTFVFFLFLFFSHFFVVGERNLFGLDF